MWKMEITNCTCCLQKEDIDPALIPRLGVSFRDQKEARAFYEAYAEKAGFGLSYGNGKTYLYIIHCSNEGVHTLRKMRTCVLGTIPQGRHTACPR
jgi:hypothetical protein